MREIKKANLSWIKTGIICMMLGFLINPVIALANPYSGGNSNCTWYVWQRANDKIGVQLPGWGNAGTWYESAKNAGYSVGTEPKADSVVVYSNSYVGHVAYVESVNGSQIYVSEGGYYTNGTKGYHEGWAPAYGRRWPNDAKNSDTVIGYIYISSDDLNTLTISANATYKTTDDITIAWNSVTGADKYGLSVWKPPYNGDENLVFDQFVYGNSHNIGKLSAGTYRCKMAAWSNGKMGIKSNEIYFTVEEADTEPPRITNVVVSDVSTLGYTVTCTVSDSSGIDRVQFPTWTLNNKQDDIQQDWDTSEQARGTINGNTVTYRVNDSDHNNEKGTYRTHIYAYDIYGNYSSAGVDVNVENQFSAINSTKYKGNTYMVFNDNLSYEEAKQKCIALGGHLAVITTAEENAMIQNLITNGGRYSYWLGATMTNDNWYWETNENFSYTNWAEGEPNNSGGAENKCEISKNGGWNDIGDTDRTRGFICEIEAVPEPTSTPTPTATLTATPKPTATPSAKITVEPTVTKAPVITAKPKVTAAANLTGAATATPTITPKPTAEVKAPAKPSIKSVKNVKGKKVIVKLKKKVNGAKGYQLTYATNSKFTKDKKNVDMKSTSKTISKLKKGKTYYVKVRAYTKDSKGKKVYGNYSNVKKVKIKK
ncbi:MAG: GBS Bsp-like repeat-containing protein [Lachnospiraceae bacterium]|nr:GBS Bsp-like repeat-containing protein [Lachnospiraceae bacterium]